MPSPPAEGPGPAPEGGPTPEERELLGVARMVDRLFGPGTAARRPLSEAPVVQGGPRELISPQPASRPGGRAAAGA